MCPHGYHHSGSMATPALGTRDVRLHIVWIALWYIYIYFFCLVCKLFITVMWFFF